MFSRLIAMLFTCTVTYLFSTEGDVALRCIKLVTARANAYTQPPVRFHRTSPWCHRLSLTAVNFIYPIRSTMRQMVREKKTIHDAISTRRNTPTTVNRKKTPSRRTPTFFLRHESIYTVLLELNGANCRMLQYTPGLSDKPPLPQCRCS